MNPFISAWDKVSVSILSPFPDGFSARNSLTSTSDRVIEDFKQNWRLALPIFVYVCEDLQELVTIYRTAVKTSCERGCLKESDIKEVAIAKRRWIPEFRKRIEFLVAGNFTFNFLPVLRFSRKSCKFIFSKIWRECHNKWPGRLNALFQREHGNKGCLWSIGVALIFGLGSSGPTPQTDTQHNTTHNFNRLLSQRVIISSNGSNSCSYSFSYSFKRIIRGTPPGIRKHVFLLFLELTYELVSRARIGGDDWKWLNTSFSQAVSTHHNENTNVTMPLQDNTDTDQDHLSALCCSFHFK